MDLMSMRLVLMLIFMSIMQWQLELDASQLRLIWRKTMRPSLIVRNKQ